MKTLKNAQISKNKPEMDQKRSKKAAWNLHHLLSSLFGEALIALLYDTALQAFGRSESAACSQTRGFQETHSWRPSDNENHWFTGKTCQQSKLSS